MSWKSPKPALPALEEAPMQRYRRHPVLWLATYLTALVSLLALALDWLWTSLMLPA